MITTHKNTQE